MKSNHLFTSMLALATIVVTSCSAPRLAQQNNSDDDVYGSTAQVKVYTPAPVVAPSATAQQSTEQQYTEDDYYGTSDPYYNMDYSSRINRFYNASPWRTYYDPYYYSGWYSDFGYGIGGGLGWGYMSSPFWGYNNFGWNNWGFNNFGWNNWGWNSWGYNNWGWNNYYGGGFLGGGYYGGGFGGGYYTGRTTNTPDYRARPVRGARDGYNAGPRSSVVPGELSSPRAASRSGRTTYTTPDGRQVTSPTRSARNSEANSINNSRPSRTESAGPSRPTRTESAPAPSYNPPTRSSSGSSGSSGGSSGGSGGGSRGGSSGGGRPTRGGGR